MDISIVVPTYNRQATVVESIERYYQILLQVLIPLNRQFEIIIVDDASKDSSFEVLQSGFGENTYIRLLRMEQNAGPGMARNAGFSHATGKWIWFLDDDDCLSLQGARKLLSALFATDDVDIVAHSLIRNYSGNLQENRLKIGNGIVSFREKQEAFNYVFVRSLATLGAIRFSTGVHEDIPYVFDLIRSARSVLVIQENVVTKIKSQHSITSTMSAERVDGFIQSYNYLSDTGRVGDVRKFLLGDNQLILDQTLGVILYLICKEEDLPARTLLEYLRAKGLRKDDWSMDIASAVSCTSIATNFQYAGSIWRNARVDDDNLLREIRGVFGTHLSCKDLDNSLFLAPDEIRACCKRFFVDGVRKGDVVLLKASDDLSLRKIRDAKDELISRINIDQAPECKGCPYLERRSKNDREINYISFENFSYCNMRCVYCSPKYWGGTEAIYSASSIVDQLIRDEGGLSSSCHVVWGGGEPTLSPRFAPINDALYPLDQIKKIRVLSNSLRYSDKLAYMMRDDRTHLVTSIDAGTQTVFEKTRGRGSIEQVLGNLQRYSSSIDDRRRITIKYILNESNYYSDELQSFVDKIGERELFGSIFQISCDFNLEKTPISLAFAIYEISVRLLMSGAKTVFFDDLIRDRLQIDDRLSRSICSHLEEYELDSDFLIKPNSADDIVLWGAGKQSEWYLRHTSSGMSNRLLGVVAEGDQLEPLLAGRKLDHISILPAGVQSMYEIIRNIEQYGLGHRIDRRVIV